MLDSKATNDALRRRQLCDVNCLPIPYIIYSRNSYVSVKLNGARPYVMRR